MVENNGLDIPTMFSHSVKIEQTSKGCRITVHVNANNSNAATKEAINLYLQTKSMLSKYEEVAPIEIREAKA
jgi:hypothetical protein